MAERIPYISLEMGERITLGKMGALYVMGAEHYVYKLARKYGTPEAEAWSNRAHRINHWVPFRYGMVFTRQAAVSFSKGVTEWGGTLQWVAIGERIDPFTGEGKLPE